MTGSTSHLPPVTSTDHRAWLWITLIICTIICPCFLLWRSIARYHRYGLDDLAVLFSFVSIVIHSALLMGGLESELGVALASNSETEITKAAKLVFASKIMLFLVLGTSKISVLLLLRRLLPSGSWRNYIVNTGVVLVAIWGIVAVLTTSIACSPSHMLSSSPGNFYQHMDIRVSVTMALSIATEIGVLGLAACTSKYMQAEATQRRHVLLAFLLRIPNIALSIAYLITYLYFVSHGPSNLGFIPVAIIQQILATYSFLSSCTPAFIITISSAFNTSFSSSEARTRKTRRRLSTPMSFFGDKIRGDREVYTHKARIFADVKEVQRKESLRKIRQEEKRKKGHCAGQSQESLKGIVREETFEVC
ncbi:hypothetical protein E4T47_05990 [Aureobasidium subglaciale]|nr:hypothetical protein E4T47_05990 [Aureobasidium subglaciale]